MNKLVIVGNGFDLAHGLPTSYKDFIDDFWANLHNTFENASIRDLVCFDESHIKNLQLESVSNYDEFCNNLSSYAIEQGFFYDNTNSSLKHSHDRSTFIFKFENHFFKEINERSHIENWVDIENDYYQKLKTISRRRFTHYTGKLEESEKKQIKQNKKAVLKLNQEFEEIKNLFESYMYSKVKPIIDSMGSLELSNSFFDFFDLTFVADNRTSGKEQFQDYLSEFPKKDYRTVHKYQSDFVMYNTEIGEGKRALENLRKLISEVVFLNFNYTRTVSLYCKTVNELYYCNPSEIKIHGELKSSDNEINFGFGDEMDEDYKLIENLDDNEYLKNFKSFKYSQNSNYKNLLDFIDSDKFQVFIMGHSCGLSDRTMLNTIFENKNCRSIKVFYHQREDESDNFTEIVQNISRHFNDKKVMRSKIVNKSLCKPLPQNIRFQKKV